MVSGRVSHFTYRIQDQLLILESFKNLPIIVRGNVKDNGNFRRIIAECWRTTNMFLWKPSMSSCALPIGAALTLWYSRKRGGTES